MKKAVFILIVIVMLFIINGLVHSIIDIYQKQDLVTSAQKELEAEKLKNAKLRGDLSYVQSVQFVDEQARDKLFLVKPGEQEVIISEDLSQKNKLQIKDTDPNWQKWINLFF